MSVLLGGMQGLHPEEAGSSAGLSIRERIIRNVVATLEGVQAVGIPISGEENTHGVTPTAGGTFTGEVTRRYRVDVVTAGASGAAKVTAYDDTPAAQSALWPAGTVADDGPVAVTVDSGTPIGIGSLGAEITLTFSGNLAIGDTWYVWAGPFQTSVAAVCREEDAREPGEGWIEVGFPQATRIGGPLGKRSWSMILPLRLHVRRAEDIATELEAWLADIEKALFADETRGGLAISTEFDANLGFALQDVKAWGFAEVPVTIHYRTADDDPRTI